MRKITTAPLVTAVMILAILPLAGAALPATASPRASARTAAAIQWVHVVNVHNHKCLTIGTATSQDLGAPVEQYTCNSNHSQNWEVISAGTDNGYHYMNEVTRDCWSIKDNVTGGATAAVIQYSCESNSDEFESFTSPVGVEGQPYIESYGDRDGASGACLHPEGDSTADSAKMDVNLPPNSTSYEWNIENS